MWLRFRTWRGAWELDDQLAGGADPLGSDELSLRSGQLRSVKTRTRIAKSLLAALEIADREVPAAVALGLLVCRPEIRDSRELLVELAGRLGADGHMEVQGLALASQLVSDGGSPLYYAHAENPLASALQLTLLALEPRPADTRDSP